MNLYNIGAFKALYSDNWLLYWGYVEWAPEANKADAVLDVSFRDPAEICSNKRFKERVGDRIVLH